MHGFAGDASEAVAAARLSISPVQEQMHPEFDWNDYALATIAYFQKDRAAFEVHRSSLKRRAASSPMNSANVDIVEGLAACFEKPYVAAYSCIAP